MTILADPEQLAVHLGVDVDGDEFDAARAERILRSVSGAIQGACTLVQLTPATSVLERRAARGRELVLPGRPVTSVAEVLVDGLEVDDVDLEVDTLVRAAGWGRIVKVTYLHGLAVVPDDVVGVCLDAAARRWESPDGAEAEQVDGYSVRRPGDLLTDAELDRLIGYRYVY